MNTNKKPFTPPAGWNFHVYGATGYVGHGNRPPKPAAPAPKPAAEKLLPMGVGEAPQANAAPELPAPESNLIYRDGKALLLPTGFSVNNGKIITPQENNRKYFEALKAKKAGKPSPAHNADELPRDANGREMLLPMGVK